MSGEPKPYVAAGPGFFGDYDSPSEARSVVDHHMAGAVYIHESIHAQALAELARLRAATAICDEQRVRDISRLTVERDTALYELDRLAGPVCPHDQRRAIEHTYLLTRFGEGEHSPWPDGEEWLRRNAR